MGFAIELGSGRTASGVRVAPGDELAGALASVGLTGPRPVLVSVGGADRVDPSDVRLRALFGAVAEVVERSGAGAVDGGTAAGVMRLLGRARTDSGGTFPLVGVAAEGTVARPVGRGREGAAPVDPDHSHLVLVPGDTWGEESPWLFRVAAALAGPSPVTTLVVDGGAVTADDVARSRAAGFPLVVVAGSGGLADRLAAEVEAERAGPTSPDRPRADTIVVAPLDDPAGVAAAVAVSLAR